MFIDSTLWPVRGGGDPVIIGKSGVNDRSIADVSQQAEVFAYPNPFDAQVYFSLNLPEKASVGVEIFTLKAWVSGFEGFFMATQAYRFVQKQG